MSQVYFKDIEHVILSALVSAKNKVYVAVSWFTNSILFDELKNALQRNVKVKVLIHDDILNRNEFGLDFGKLVTLGAEIRFSNSNEGTMHNKFCVIDDQVITGSYNWTYQANYNDENVIVINELDISHSFNEKFESLFNAGKPIKIPYEHLKWTDIKDGDFTELRRNIYRDVIARNDENKEIKRDKLINLNDAYKSGDVHELDKASSLPTTRLRRTLTEVLTSRSHDYELCLWKENVHGIPCATNVDGYCYIGEWYYIPQSIEEDNCHREYIKGILKTKLGRDNIFFSSLNLNIYDEKYLSTIKMILGTKCLSNETRKLIPDILLRIDKARMFFYQFQVPMYDKRQSSTWNNGEPRQIKGLNLWGLVKEDRDNEIVFYDGWDPNKRGEKIMKEFFVKELY